MTEERIRALIHQSWDMPYGPAQIAVAEEAIAQADALGDDELRFEARMAATNSYQHGGEPAKGFVTFSWCLTRYDSEPERFGQHEHLLLWYFKYMIHSLTRFPEVPLARTYAVLDDMQRRFLAGGHSLQAVHKHRWLVAMHVGDVDAAERHYEAWQAAPRDSNSDCVGCDPTDEVWHLSQHGRYEEAIQLTGPVLAGRLTCAEQPQAILTQLLVPYLHAGQLEQARSAHHTAYRSIRGSHANLANVADHLYFLGVSGNELYGVELLERHLPWLEKAPTPHSRMWFAASGALVLRRVTEAGHGDLQVAGGTAKAFGETLAQQALALAHRFDERNGTTHQSDLVTECLVAQPIVDKLPLSITATLAAPVTDLSVPAPATVVDDPGEIPAGASLDELLDLAEEALWRDHTARIEALWERIDDLASNEKTGEDLTTLQRARIADMRGMRLYDRDEKELVISWQQAIDGYAEAGDVIREQRMLGRMGLHRCRHGEPEEGLEQVRVTTDFLLEHGSPRDRAGALRRLAVALLHAGDPGEAVAALDRLVDVNEPDPGKRVALQAMMIRAQALGAHGQLDVALDTATDLVARAHEAGDAEMIGLGEFILGQTNLLLEENQAAVEAYERALTSPELAADLRREIRERRGMLLAGTNRAAEAISDLASLVSRLVTEGQPEEADYGRFQLAVALFNADRAADAAEVAEEALYGADRSGNQGLADQVRHLLAAVYQRLDDPDQALMHLDQLAANLNGFDNADQRGRVLEQAGDVLFELDKDGQAAQRFEASAAAYSVAGHSIDRLRALRRQSVASMFGLGPEAALKVLAQADEVALTVAADRPEVAYELAWLSLDGARVLAGVGEADTALERVAGVPQRFRSLESFGEAFLSELTMGEILLTLGRPGEAEPVLRGVVGGLPRDAGPLPRAAYALAHALIQLGKTAEAHTLADQYGFDLD